jgi:aspartyl-tRNA(Asn)/glutamyl-tRNA(Gln) amidotransferase subunit A
VQTPVQTAAQFRAAVERLHAFRADRPTRPPGFMGRLQDRFALGGSQLPMRAGPATSARVQTGEVLTATGALRALASGKVSSAELVEQAYAAIDRWESQVHAFEYVVPREEALRQAAERDRTPLDQRGPLWGIPTSIKDIIHVGGLPTSASSRTLQGYVPEEDAEAVARLRQAGAVIVGKSTTHEFAMGVTTPQSRNPWDVTRDPGGSSGGAAVTLATGMALAALGTDTRASIRAPAALCGTVGFKPTFGLVSTHGVVTMSWTMDHVAPMARTTEDIALLLNVLVGHDAKDPGTLRSPAVDYRSYLQCDVRGLRVGVPTNGLRNAQPGVLACFQEALDALTSAGVELVELAEPTIDDFELANAAGLIVSRCEAAVIHNSLLQGERDYTQDVREQIEEASQVLATEYLEAQRYRAELTDRMAQVLSQVDVLALPTSRVVAPRSEESDQYLLVLSENCVPWSFIGFPAASFPCGLTAQEHLPVGIELVAAPFAEPVLLALGTTLETALDMPLLP